MADFSGRTAIVTGAAQGLGLEIAGRLANDGANVVMWDREEAMLAEASRALAQRYGEASVSFAPLDLTNGPEVDRAVRRVIARHGSVDILVNSAGGSGVRGVKDIESLDESLWESIIRSNLHSVFLCCKYVVPHMKDHGYGRIVNFSSVVAGGILGELGTVGARLPYAAAKAGIIGLSRQLAKDLGPCGITVNVVSPGLIVPSNGGRVKDRFNALPPTDQERMLQAIPMGRAGQSEDVAESVAYLVSEASGYVSGAVLDINGGWS